MSRYDDVGGADEPASTRGPRGNSRRHLRRRIAAWVSVGLTFVLVAAALGAYVEYRNVVDSIHRVKITDLGKRPPKYTSALNILLIGSDSRKGRNKRFGAGADLVDGPQRSDTVILLHISPGRHGATVISFPRDSTVPILACAARGTGVPGQQPSPGSVEQINSTFADGGPACLWKTVEQTTGIRIDHFVELNFTGFIHVINDIGGVNVCLPFAVDDANSGLHMKVGRHHVGGMEALQFWRTRESVGAGSDLQRIQRDQYLMASLLQGVEHSNILGSPTTLLSVVKDIADAMTTDMDTSSLLQIAESVKGLSTKSVQFIEVPTVPATVNPAWVTWSPQAPALFAAVAHDRKLPKPGKKVTGPKTTPVLDANPSQVDVKVLNGSGMAGLASTAAASLTSRGFNVVGTGDASNFGYVKSVIKYASPADKSAVKTLKHQLSNVTVEQDSSLTPGTLELIIGSVYQGLRTSPSPSASRKPSKPAVGSLAKNFNGITGNASCSSDGAAFAGPNSPPVP
jgi:LCP family protein required for cell wall assembly